MKIIILGAGQVGASAAENLVSEHEITLIDQDAERLRLIQERLDLRAVAGNAAYPSVLKNAGAQDADLLIAVTRSEETNLVACKIAHSVFNVPICTARLRSPDFLHNPALLSEENFAVDFALCPEQLITQYIARLVQFPEALEVHDFAEGRVSLVAVRAYEGGFIVGKPLRELREHLPAGLDARIAAIYRRGKPIFPGADTTVEVDDEVFVLAAAEHIRTVLRELRRAVLPVRRIMVAGGGNIGLKVAQALEGEYSVKLIEYEPARAQAIAQSLKHTLVLSGDATDEALLAQENIAEMDMFLALTNDDEDNIMAASVAKRMGCRLVASLVGRRAYGEMMQGGIIDISISPSHVSIGPLLAHVRKGDVAAVQSLRRGAAEALELVAHGDADSSRVVGRRISEIPWPWGVTPAALVRDFDVAVPVEVRDDGTVDRRFGRVEIAHGSTVIRSGDHVILFCLEKKLVAKVEKLFQVGLRFF
jgi:trk system potassium uptake protein TrkA